MTIAAILLAARRAEAARVPVALSAWGDDETQIEWQLGQLIEAGADVVEVVLGYEAERIIALIAADNVEPIVHAAWASDEAGAVRIGATAVPRGTGTAIIVDIERPCSAGPCAALFEAHTAAGRPITRASRAGAPGWPVVVDGGVLAELRNATDERGGLGGVLQRHEAETQLVEVGADL